MDLEAFSSVASQMMSSETISLNGDIFPVRRTSTSRLRTVAFTLGGHTYTAIEQNPEKPSRWGQLARAGHQVVQFKDDDSNRFVAVAVDGKLKQYTK